MSTRFHETAETREWAKNAPIVLLKQLYHCNGYRFPAREQKALADCVKAMIDKRGWRRDDHGYLLDEPLYKLLKAS